MNYSSLVISNSPVEFVITGPVKGKDRVLVRSENSSIDLIGKATQFEANFRSRTSWFSNIFKPGRQINVVESSPVPDMRQDVDSRTSLLRFAWVGQTTKQSYKRIEKAFTYSVPSILTALEDKDLEQVEIYLGRVILNCSEENDNWKRRRITFLLIMSAYLISVSAFFGSEYLRSIFGG
jgi:hypothetical protein